MKLTMKEEMARQQLQDEIEWEEKEMFRRGYK